MTENENNQNGNEQNNHHSTTFQLHPQYNVEHANMAEEIARQIEWAKQTLADNPILAYKSMPDWILKAMGLPVPRKIFDSLFFQNELCILFSDTNLGKSILAIQIADALSKGVPIPGFELEAPAMTVLYLDFELSEKQLELRYSANYEKHYDFSPNLLRAEIKRNFTVLPGQTFEDTLMLGIEKAVVDTGCQVIIIDNITYLRTETEKAKEAASLMKCFRTIRDKYDLTMLVLAHTPKRDMSKEITANDLGGSKMLMNFADSAFAIGKSTQGTSRRYIKQIKQRSTEQVNGGDKVIVCNLEKSENFLGFKFEEYSNERAHLKQYDDLDKETREEKILELKSSGLSNREIANQLHISHTLVNTFLKVV